MSQLANSDFTEITQLIVSARQRAVQAVKRYKIHDLVWYEPHETMENAIQREKQLKKWDRKAKIGLIEKNNPQWQDLWPKLSGN